MITCHLINVLKAFHSPQQDKSQNLNRKISARTRKTHTSTYTFTVRWAMSLTVIWGCSYEYSLFVHIEMQYQVEDACAFYWWESSGGLEVGGWREKSKTWHLLPTLQFRSNVHQCKWWRVQGVHLIPNNKWYQSQMGAIKDLLGEWEEGLKRKRVSRFVLSPGALKHSNYHTAVKMHTSSSHRDVLRCFSATHGSSFSAIHTSTKINSGLKFWIPSYSKCT